MIENEKILIMYFNSNLRNIFLMISVSFGGLAYSRNFRKGDGIAVYNISLILFSIISLFLSLFSAYNLINDIKSEIKNDEEKYKLIQKWLIIPQIIIYVIIILLILALSTLVRETNNYLNA